MTQNIDQIVKKISIQVGYRAPPGTTHTYHSPGCEGAEEARSSSIDRGYGEKVQCSC
jgi:hypothetical protein